MVLILYSSHNKNSKTSLLWEVTRCHFSHLLVKIQSNINHFKINLNNINIHSMIRVQLDKINSLSSKIPISKIKTNFKTNS